MKKRFNFLISIIISLSFILFSSSAFSKGKCHLYFEKLKSDFEIYQPDFYPRFEYNDFGFVLDSHWDDTKKEWILNKDKNGFFSIGKISSNDLVDQISVGDLVISANGKDLRDQNLTREEGLDDLFSEGENVKFIFKNKQNYNLSLSKKKKDLIDPFADFYIRSLDIDESSKKIEVRIQSQISHSFYEDDEMYKLAREYLWFDKNDENKNTKDCFYNVKDWDEAGFAHPAIGLVFANLHSIDYDTFDSSILIKPYTHEIDWHKEFGWDNELYVQYADDGIYKFNTNFKYNNFPFDKQTISIKLLNGHDMSDGVLTVSDFTKLFLIDFQKKNNISGWDIVDNRLLYGSYKDPVDINYISTISLELDIERKSGYYLYKVILPIIIILSVCWASIYVSPRELESKLTITIVCLLSLIAYNFIIDGEIPKLEYLTIMDWIILASYVYAALPNILAIYSFNLYKNKNTKKLNRYNDIAKRYGLLSYLLVIFSIILFNVSSNPENASAAFSWMSGI